MDLAGSERQSKTEATGDRLKEVSFSFQYFQCRHHRHHQRFHYYHSIVIMTISQAITSLNPLIHTTKGDKDQLVPLRLGKCHLCPCGWQVQAHPLQVDRQTSKIQNSQNT